MARGCLVAMKAWAINIPMTCITHLQLHAQCVGTEIMSTCSNTVTTAPRPPPTSSHPLQFWSTQGINDGVHQPPYYYSHRCPLGSVASYLYHFVLNVHALNPRTHHYGRPANLYVEPLSPLLYVPASVQNM